MAITARPTSKMAQILMECQLTFESPCAATYPSFRGNVGSIWSSLGSGNSSTTRSNAILTLARLYAYASLSTHVEGASEVDCQYEEIGKHCTIYEDRQMSSRLIEQ